MTEKACNVPGCCWPRVGRSPRCVYHRVLTVSVSGRAEYVRANQATPPPGEPVKTCTRCGAVGPDWFFTGARCDVCVADVAHAGRVKRTYGLDDYDGLLRAQGGRCAICGTRPGQQRLAVDHDHKTGKVRGLLCMRCNKRVLGGAKENPTILRAAAEYLERGGAS